MLAGDLGVAGTGCRHVAAVMFASETRIVQVDDHRLFVIAARSPAALPGRMAGAADAREQFSSLGFTHGDPFTGDRLPCSLALHKITMTVHLIRAPLSQSIACCFASANRRILAAIEYWEMAHPTRFERVAFAFGGQRSRYAAN
jgi:hypothetical protein